VWVATIVVPGQFWALCSNASNKNWQEALEIDETLRHLYGILSPEPNPIPVKWA
jgi:dihydrodipicolinate synthase/N-acetylneuraminate lyase